MEGESRSARLLQRITEQQWFQQLKGKWEELDPQSRLYLKYAGGIAAALVVFGTLGSTYWRVRGLRKELAAKNELIQLVQSATDELRRLRESVPAVSQGGRPGEAPVGPWGPYFESTAASSSIEKANLTIGPEKPGSTTEQAKESLYQLTVKKVNIKQIVRFAFLLESGARPMKLRHLTIDTKADPTGYMDATLSMSAFTLSPPLK